MHLKYVIPTLGKLISPDPEAYAYLPASVAEFPSPQAFMAILRDAGFSRVRHVPLTFGIVSLYVAER